VLVGLDVREIAATGEALWGWGRRSLRDWRRRRAYQTEGSKKSLLKADQSVNLAARLFPEPESRPWVEQAGLVLLKPGLRRLFELIPEETCVAIYKRIRWLGKLCCLWLPGSESKTPAVESTGVAIGA
jgi:hypothetical protein